MFISAVFVAAALSCLISDANGDTCDPYSLPPFPQAHQFCNDTRAHRSTEYTQLETAIYDAMGNEHTEAFGVEVLLAAYEYLYPCSQTAGAALHMFYPTYDWSVVPSREWYDKMNAVIQNGTKRLLGQEYLLLIQTLDKIKLQTGTAVCIQRLIYANQGTVENAWKQMYRDFYQPTTTTSTTVTVATTTAAAVTVKNCAPFGELPVLGSFSQQPQCVSTHYTGLNNLLVDAAKEQQHAFVIQTLLKSYTYLHPCASIAETALTLFYPDGTWIPPDDSVWFTAMETMINSSGPHFQVADDALLQNTLQQIISQNQNSPACVQHLIETHKEGLSEQWQKLYPNFSPPVPETTTVTTTITTTPEITTQGTTQTTPNSCYPFGEHVEHQSCSRTRCLEIDACLKVDAELRDATQLEDLHIVAIDIMTEMFKYLYPCRNVNDILFSMFFAGAHVVPPSDSPWWREMESKYNKSIHLLSADLDILNGHLDNITEEGSAACIMQLINSFKGNVKAYWHEVFPSHPNGQASTTTPALHTTSDIPAVTPAPPTTTTTTTTTAAPTTTTPAPTTTTTTTTSAPPTTTTTTTTTTTAAAPTTTTTTTPTPTTTTAATTTTPAPVQCTQCQDLECLRIQHVEVCEAGQTLCITNITETNDSRTIARGCATEQQCDALLDQPDDCLKVESHKLPNNTDCFFCCHGEDCNRPPQLAPDPFLAYRRGP